MTKQILYQHKDEFLLRCLLPHPHPQVNFTMTKQISNEFNDKCFSHCLFSHSYPQCKLAVFHNNKKNPVQF